MVGYSRQDLFLEGIFEFKQVIKSASGSTNNINNLQNGKFFWIVRLKRALKSSEDLPV